nr:hypothetical protein [Mesorhizobium sp.]
MSAVQRVEQDQATLAAVDDALDEPVLRSHLREHLEKQRPVVMVAEHQPARRNQPCQSFLQRAVGGPFTRIGEVAGNHHQFGVGMVCADVAKAGFQPGEWI